MTCVSCRDRGVLANGEPCLECENRALFESEEFEGDVLPEWVQ